MLKLTRKPLNILFALCAFALVIGCIDVTDVTERWNSSTIDKELEGMWESDEAVMHFSPSADGSYYVFSSTNDENVYAVRSVIVNDERFMIWANLSAVLCDFENISEEKLGGQLVRYVIEDGQLNFYTLQNDQDLKDRIEEGVIAGTLEEDSDNASLDSLDDATMAVLAEMATKVDWMTFGGDMTRPVETP